MAQAQLQSGQDPLYDGPGIGLFVGRRRELEQLHTVLEEAFSGRGRLVMLAGEPGIGKTRLAQELAAEAVSRGASVLWGWCYEEAGAPPYWPWVQALRSYIHQAGPDQLRQEMGAGAADIAEVVPEVREKLPELEPSPALAPEQARFRLFDSITAFLKNASRSQSLMLVLDDLHWADRSSLLLLEFLTREITSIPLLVLGTYRDVEVDRRHPLAEVLGGLIREQSLLRVRLSGLSTTETGQLIRQITGATPPAEVVETIHSRTEGNPLFLAEVARMLTREGLDPWQDRVNEIPEGVRAALGRHFNHLSEDCNRVMTIASVIGREFSFPLLRLVSPDLEEEQLLTLVEEALEAHVIEQSDQPPETYRFRHALIRETLLSEMASSRRVRWHAAIGQALERLHSTDIAVHASELAYHFGQAEPALSPEKLVRYSLLAGERALATYAWEEALEHFQRGLTATEGSPMDAETATLWFGLGRAQSATRGTFEYRQVFDSLSRAFDYYAELGDISGAVTVAEFPIRAALGVVVGSAELASRALALAPDGSPGEARLLTNYGLTLYQETGDFQGAQEAFDRAMTIGRRENRPDIELRALANRVNVDFHHMKWPDCLEAGLNAMALVGRCDEPQAEFTAGLFTTRALNNLGDLSRARHFCQVTVQLAERFRHRGWIGQALQATGQLSQHVGEFQAAKECMDRSISMEPQEPRHRCIRTVLAYESGEPEPDETHLERLLELIHRSPMGAGFA